MGRVDFIESELWEEVEKLSPWATLLFIWSFSNSRGNSAGIFKVSRSAMTESKVPRHKIDDALAELAQGRFVYYVDGVMWVRAKAKRSTPKDKQAKNPKIASAIAKSVGRIDPGHPLRVAFIDYYGQWEWLKGDLASLSEGLDSRAESSRGIDTPSMGPVEAEVEVVPSLRVVER